MRTPTRPTGAALGLLIAATVVVAGCVPDTRPASCEASAVTIELALSASSLEPSDPAVCRDQEVTMLIDSEVDGTFHIHGYDADVPAATVSAGEQLTLEFTASRSGQFPIELHPAEDPTGLGIGVFTVHEP
jgi:hypothetical protein